MNKDKISLMNNDILSCYTLVQVAFKLHVTMQEFIGTETNLQHKHDTLLAYPLVKIKMPTVTAHQSPALLSAK
jgi:hypothetical protein